MGFEDVIDMVLSMITDYDMVEWTDDDIYTEFASKVNIVIAKAGFEEFSFDTDMNSFVDLDGLDYELSILEANIIAHGLVMQWIYPKVHNTEILEYQLTNKEFTAFSNANRINSMIQLQKNAQAEFYYLVNNYDFLKQKAEWKEERDK